jgi:hypothetical protein
MGDRELIAMAAFRIGKAAKRLRILAAHTESSALRKALLQTARKLDDHVTGMRSAAPAGHVVATAETRDAVPSPAADP